MFSLLSCPFVQGINGLAFLWHAMYHANHPEAKSERHSREDAPSGGHGPSQRHPG